MVCPLTWSIFSIATNVNILQCHHIHTDASTHTRACQGSLLHGTQSYSCTLTVYNKMEPHLFNSLPHLPSLILYPPPPTNTHRNLSCQLHPAPALISSCPSCQRALLMPSPSWNSENQLRGTRLKRKTPAERKKGVRDVMFMM